MGHTKNPVIIHWLLCSFVCLNFVYNLLYFCIFTLGDLVNGMDLIQNLLEGNIRNL